MDEALRAAGRHLPAWVPWAPLLVLPLAFLLGLVLTSLAALVGLAPLSSLRADAHWTERARRTFPALRSSQAGLWLAAFCAAAAGWFAAGLWCVLAPKPLAVLAGLAAYAGGSGPLAVAWHVAQRRRFRLATWCRWFAATWLLFGTSVPLALLVFLLMPERLDAAAAGLLILGVGGLVWLSRGGVIRLGLLLGLVRPASQRLATVIGSLAARVGRPAPPAYEVDLGQANGVALPFAGAVIVTSEALALLDDEELSALCAHELGHLSESRAAGLTRLVPGLFFLSLAAIRPLGHAWGWPAALAAPFIAFLVVALLKRLWRRLEQRSDRVAVQYQSDAGVFARALEKSYQHNLTPAVMSPKRAIHPHLYDRLLAAGVTPGYARPARPLQWPSWIALVLQITPAYAAILAIAAAPSLVGPARSESAIEWSLAVRPTGKGWALDTLARLRAERGDTTAAIDLARAAAELDQDSLWYAADWAVYSARGNRCDEAGRAIDLTLRRCDADCDRTDDELARARAEVVEACRGATARQAGDRPGRSSAEPID